jgi:acetyl esterase/lipase
VLGFQSDKIIVSGESVGGNLAAALTVTIIMDQMEHQSIELTASKSMEFVNDREDDLSGSENEDGSSDSSRFNIFVPDALIIGCPALNLSLELTPSRVEGANDPVLPSGLIAAISNSYIPLDGDYPKTHPIASPYFASDEILRQFPPTLIFTSSEDPFRKSSLFTVLV